MRIKLLSAAILFVASPAMAAPITETWIAPGGGINAEKSKIVAPGTSLNGKTVQDAMTQIDANTTAAADAQTTANTGVTNAATAQSSADAAQTTASAAIPLAQKGTASGVAELDSRGNSTAPVSTTGDIVSNGTQQLGLSPAIPVLPNDAGSNSSTETSAVPLATNGYAWNGDGWQNPSMLMLGGKQPFQNAGLSIYGAPYSYSNTGTLLDIEMTNGTWSGYRSGSGDFDAIGQFIRAGNTTPYYKIGEDFTDDTGTTHTLAFDKTGVTVTPALPTSFFSMWAAHGSGGGPGMLIITNLEATAPTTTAAKPGWPAQQNPNLWSGYVTGYSSVTGGTHLDMANGWQPTSGWVGTGGSQSSVPDDSVGLDQVYYSVYTHPILILGTYMQAFDQNLKCSLDIDSTSTASQKTQLSRNDAPVQSCQGNELDVYVPNTKPDGFMHVQGFTADLLNSSPLVSPNSLAFDAQGNWPVAYQTGLGTDGKDFFGGVLDVNSRRGPDSTIGDTTEIMEATQGADYSTDVRSNMAGIRLTQHVDTIGEGGVAGVHYPADNSIHLGEWVGGTQYGEDGTTLGEYGTYKGDLVFNPGWLKGGLALCGSVNNYTNSSSSCVGVATGGQVTITPNQTSTGVGLNVDPTGYTGGSAGSAAIAIGAVPSTAATAMGIYQDSTYGNDLEEIQVGGSNRRSLNASGDEVLSGMLTAGGNISVKGGNSLFLYNTSNSSSDYMYYDTDGLEHHAAGIYAPTFTSTGNITIGSGSALLFTTASSSVQPYLFSQLADSSASTPTLYLTNNAGTKQGVSISGLMETGSGTKNASVTLANLPTTGEDGTELWCSDCTLNSVTGVPVFWHSSTSKWLDSQNNTPVN